MDTEISIQKRKAVHESMVMGLQATNQKENIYKHWMELGNKGLQELSRKLKNTEDAIRKFEEDRANQCHSSINQFVVFEKYAEMNNKYDVKNFSDIIE